MPECIVFISYSHDSAGHRDWVLGLSERLREDGFETRLDRYVKGTPDEGWPRWMLNRLDEATHVLVVCTETYYRRFRGHEAPGLGKGVDWEGALITQEMYDARSSSKKFVPVLRTSGDTQFIPEPLRGATHYVLDSEERYQDLCDFLRGQAGIAPGPVGIPKTGQRETVRPIRFGVPEVGPRSSGELPHTVGSGVENVVDRPDSEFHRTVKENMRRVMLPADLVSYRGAIGARLGHVAAMQRVASSDFADGLLAETTDRAIGRVLLPATQDCLDAKGPAYAECGPHRTSIRDAAEQLLGWLVLSSVQEDHLLEQGLEHSMSQGLRLDISARTPMAAEIIVSRRFEREAHFELDPGGPYVRGRHQVTLNCNPAIWDKAQRLRDMRRALWNAVMNDQRESDLDEDSLRLLNAELHFHRTRDYEPIHFYFAADRRSESAEHDFDDIYTQLQTDLPDLTLVRFGCGTARDVFIVPEENLMVSIRHFLHFLSKVTA
ncbi:MAG: SEFIR domain-containing protein [Methylotetracoccus sp.]